MAVRCSSSVRVGRDKGEAAEGLRQAKAATVHSTRVPSIPGPGRLQKCTTTAAALRQRWLRCRFAGCGIRKQIRVNVFERKRFSLGPGLAAAAVSEEE